MTSRIGPLRSDEKSAAAFATTLEHAQALQVRALVLPTPADLTPGARSRELLRAFTDKLPRVAGRHYVWSPSGVWGPDETAELCKELGLVRAFDPLQTPTRPEGDVVYAELRALGHRSGFSLAALDDALSVIDSAETREAFISVDSPRGFDVAKRLLQLALERGFDMPAGLGTRPASNVDPDERDEDEDDGLDEDDDEDEDQDDNENDNEDDNEDDNDDEDDLDDDMR